MGRVFLFLFVAAAAACGGGSDGPSKDIGLSFDGPGVSILSCGDGIEGRPGVTIKATDGDGNPVSGMWEADSDDVTVPASCQGMSSCTPMPNAASTAFWDYNIAFTAAVLVQVAIAVRCGAVFGDAFGDFLGDPRLDLTGVTLFYSTPTTLDISASTAMPADPEDTFEDNYSAAFNVEVYRRGETWLPLASCYRQIHGGMKDIACEPSSIGFMVERPWSEDDPHIGTLDFSALGAYWGESLYEVDVHVTTFNLQQQSSELESDSIVVQLNLQF